ncbi:MAG: hypothetical protein KZQ82_06080 [Candidatus Thiodiazotropha sp. (ex Lucinoma annulata)]|nr:hypothetical protein [Candidatus Thiodiazotropha sp. (ex Lucinoma annulata)]
MEGYVTEILKVAELTETTLSDMSRIYLAHYDSCDEERFRNDLTVKTEALLVYQQRELVGFTLYALYRETWQESPVRIIYSGDTVVDHAHWGQQALAFSWLSRAGQIKRYEPEIPLYWFLIVKGHRTYRYLPTFSRVFHPHWSKPSMDLKSLADWLAKKKFGTDYDPGSGVVAFKQSRGHLNEAYAHPTSKEVSKEAVQFFLRRNPGYLRGEELVCLCELHEENLRPLAQRLFIGTR